VADSKVFTRTCEELAKLTGLDLVAMRGIVRLALKEAGLHASAVGVEQMRVLLSRVLPGELKACGVTDPEGVCAALERAVAGLGGGGESDEAAAAAAVFERFGRR
jgi:hypothetical protein